MNTRFYWFVLFAFAAFIPSFGAHASGRVNPLVDLQSSTLVNTPKGLISRKWRPASSPTFFSLEKVTVDHSLPIRVPRGEKLEKPSKVSANKQKISEELQARHILAIFPSE